MRYLFESERLGFRRWEEEDIEPFAKMCADEEVMEHFPETLSKQQTIDFVTRCNDQLDRRGYTYFAVDKKATNSFIGFIGLSYQDYHSEYTPSVDIGWRLMKSAWGKGYATEGAKRVLKFAEEDCEIAKVIAVCTINNIQSENVMQKIGMLQKGVFNHPKLEAFPDYQSCKCYEIELV